MEPIMLDREDQPTNSIEELDHDDQTADFLQDGRTYECMYCKHGFTTAQALGGHMNVHRKDRAKTRWSANSSNNKTTTGLGTHQPCLATGCSPNHHQEGRGAREFIQSRLSAYKIYDNNNITDRHQNSNGATTSLAGEEIRLSLGLSLSLQFGRSHEEEHIQKGNEDDELDLELRLGCI